MCNGADYVARRGRQGRRPRRRHRGDGGLHPPHSARRRPRDHPAGPQAPDADPHDAGPDLRPADRHGLRRQAGLLLGRQSRASARCTASATRSRTAGRSSSRSRSTRTPPWPTPTRRAPPGCRARSSAAISAPTCRRSIPNIKCIDCPFTGEKLAAIPAHRPDVAVIHAQRADRKRQRDDRRHARRAEGSGARRQALGGDGRGDRRRFRRRAAERRGAAALDRQRSGRSAGRRVSVLCAGLLPAQQRLLQAVGRRSRASATRSWPG